MADNTLQQANDNVATDDIGGVKYQRVKATWGVDGTATDVAATVAAALPVTMVANLLQAVTTLSVTTSSSSIAADVSAAGNASVTIHGTYAGVNLTFEASDDAGTTYYPIAGLRSDTGMAEFVSGVLPANTSRWWDFDIPGFSLLRVRSTAFTSGTGLVRITPSIGFSEHMPTALTRAVPAAVGTQTSATAAITDTTILAANTARLSATLYNDSTSQCRVLVATSPGASSTTAFTYMMAAGGTLEVGGTSSGATGYVGIIKGIWVSANGAMRVTEYTPAA